MSSKLYKLLVAVIGGVSVIANALIAYFNPPISVALIASITALVATADEIMANFIKDATTS